MKKNITKKTLNDLIGTVGQGQILSQNEARLAMNMVLSSEGDLLEKTAFIYALTKRGEPDENEVSGFLTSLQEHMATVYLPDHKAMDVCGTGGDGKHTFNISTVSVFVLAGVGVRVAKHGNRAMSGSFGSADLMERLGVNIHFESGEIARCLKNTGVCFMYAPLFQPRLKQIQFIRKSLGIPTIFNMLGPLLNPARVETQVIGVADEKAFHLIAKVCTKVRPNDQICLVRSDSGADEVALAEGTTLVNLGPKGLDRIERVDHTSFGLPKHPWESVVAKSPDEQVQMAKDVLAGRPGPARDIVLANSAVALRTYGLVKTLLEGVTLAAQSIDSGSAERKLKKLTKY